MSFSLILESNLFFKHHFRLLASRACLVVPLSFSPLTIIATPLLHTLLLSCLLCLKHQYSDDNVHISIRTRSEQDLIPTSGSHGARDMIFPETETTTPTRPRRHVGKRNLRANDKAGVTPVQTTPTTAIPEEKITPRRSTRSLARTKAATLKADQVAADKEQGQEQPIGTRAVLVAGTEGNSINPPPIDPLPPHSYTYTFDALLAPNNTTPTTPAVPAFPPGPIFVPGVVDLQQGGESILGVMDQAWVGAAASSTGTTFLDRRS